MVPKIGMIHWMCDHTRLDNIRNEVIRDKVGVTHIKNKMGETRVRWLGHVRRSSIDAPRRRCERIDFPDVDEI